MGSSARDRELRSRVRVQPMNLVRGAGDSARDRELRFRVRVQPMNLSTYYTTAKARSRPLRRRGRRP